MRMVARLAVSFSFLKRNGQTANNADISFRNIPIPEKCEWHMHAIDL